jgi:NAD kinase
MNESRNKAKRRTPSVKVLLFGAEVDTIRPEFAKYPRFDIVTEAPDVVVCYGGDGTLLSAEREWPSAPKTPIRNSLRGNRCIAHPAPDVIARLAHDELVRTEYMKL